MHWNYSDLLKQVLQIHGEVAEKELRTCLDALAWKCDFYRYHASESVKHVDELSRSVRGVEPADSVSIALMKTILMAHSGDSSARGFIDGKMRSEAHLIAAAQAVHSLADIMTHAVYWSLGIALKMSESQFRNISLANAVKCDAINLLVREDMQKLLVMDEFKYLGAFVNVIKHRRLVPAGMSADVSHIDSYRRGIRLEPFQYMNCSFERKWGIDFLQHDMPIVMDRTISIGRTLGALLDTEIERIELS